MKHRLSNTVMMFSVCCFSLALLVYVAEGKAGKSYEQFYREAGLAQGQLVQGAVEAFLRQDVPLRQFAGFNALTESLAAAHSAVAAVTISNDRGEAVFSSENETAPPGPGGFSGQGGGADQRRQEQHAHVTLPLRGKFEVVGAVTARLKLQEVSARVTEAFRPLWLLVPVSSAAFALLTLCVHAAPRERKRRWTAVAFAGTFIGVAGAVIVTLVALYADGASAKGRALLTSLSGRLDTVGAYGLNFDQIEGLDRVFADYRRLNSDISAIALVVDGTVSVHTDPSRTGVAWTPPQGTYDHVVDIGKAGSPRSIQVAMALPKDLVYRQVVDSVRNILALFVASGLFAYFFMDLAQALQGARGGQTAGSADKPALALGLVKPVFFLATFVEHLNYAFLPQYVQGVAQASGGYTSAPFIAYYLCFAASLIPAGRFESRHGPHGLIWGGLVLAACGLLTLVGQLGFASLVAARALSGIGQGILFIGVQSYILRTTTSDGRTRGASVIVVGFQAGMISGMAIGSLLVAQLGARGVFELGAAVAAATALYAAVVIPKLAVHGTRQGQQGHGRATAWRGIASTLRDVQFLKAIGLIGLPAKAVLTGVILFALPLLLAQRGYGQEDIGQITMVYAAGVIAASAWVSRRADRPHATGGILVWGSVLSGTGLLLISSLGWEANAFGLGQMLPATALVVAGVTAVGVAHGFINAPIVTHVTDARVSARLGAGSVAATYRLLERAGHTAGPAVVAQVIASAGSSLLALGWIGGTLIALGLLFAVSSAGKAGGLEPETA